MAVIQKRNLTYAGTTMIAKYLYLFIYLFICLLFFKNFSFQKKKNGIVVLPYGLAQNSLRNMEMMTMRLPQI